MITLFRESVATGALQLDGQQAQHAHVRRIVEGDAIRLVDGAGRVALGVASSVRKGSLTVDIESVEEVPRPSALELLVPVADRDHMLLAAEKCVELQVTAWRPAFFARSRSVSPRGEGEKFREKVLARMRAALEQSGGAWLPTLLGESDLADALAGVPTQGTRVMLDARGTALPMGEWKRVAALAVGPEGGIEEAEVSLAREHGWTIASVGASTLRFETAIIAGAALVRAAQHSAGSA